VGSNKQEGGGRAGDSPGEGGEGGGTDLEGRGVLEPKLVLPRQKRKFDAVLRRRFVTRGGGCGCGFQGVQLGSHLAAQSRRHHQLQAGR
jgi:hypothetical protein